MGKLRVIREFDPWRSPLCTCPFKYSLHPYTGCSHRCLYCYATSYIGLRDSTPKKQFLENLARDLERIGEGAIVELSTSSDPYPPVEARLGLTRRALALMSKYKVRVLITTKSDLVVRDVDVLLKQASAVMMTITTLDEKLSAVLEPGAPPPSRRVEALKKLSNSGISVGVRIDPIIPYLNDDPAALEELIGVVKEHGAQHIVTSTYKARWDSMRRLEEHFSDVARKLRRLYFEEGVYFHGYRYLSKNLRESLLRRVVKVSSYYGLSVATCREGLGREFFKAPSCDGSHLITYRGSVKPH